MVFLSVATLLGCFSGVAHAHFAAAIKLAVIQHRVGGIVMGWPLDPYGAESAGCRSVELLVARLQALQVHVPIIFWDERGSSAQAKLVIRTGASANRSREKAVRVGLSLEQRQRVDEEAAVVILQSFINAARLELAL